MPGPCVGHPRLHFLVNRKKDVDSRNSRLHQGFAGFSVLVAEASLPQKSIFGRRRLAKVEVRP
jgi:hypothetical protein